MQRRSTVIYHNDDFVDYILMIPPPEQPIRRLVCYIVDLEERHAMGTTQDEGEDLQDWYERRVSWVVEFMELLEIPAHLLQTEIQETWSKRGNTGCVDIAVSHFVDTATELLSKRSD